MIISEGQQFLNDAKTLLKSTKNIKKLNLNEAAEESRSYKIIHDCMVSENEIRKLLHYFSIHFPRISLLISARNILNYPKSLIDEDFDAAITSIYFFDRNNFECRLLSCINKVVMTSIDSELSLKIKSSKNILLENETQVISEETNIKGMINFHPPVISSKTIFANNIDKKLHFIRNGLGWGFLPFNFKQNFQGKDLLIIPSLESSRKYYFKNYLVVKAKNKYCPITNKLWSDLFF